jgi:hypothetical protein
MSAERTRERADPTTTREFYEYIVCPDVYHGQPCGDGHTPESVDVALAGYDDEARVWADGSRLSELVQGPPPPGITSAMQHRAEATPKACP